MNKTEFMEGIHILQNNYNRALTSEQLKLFYENLKDMDKDKYMANIQEIVKNSAYMPNIAQIRGIEQRKQYSSYKQRDCIDVDFSKFYANKE